MYQRGGNFYGNRGGGRGPWHPRGNFRGGGPVRGRGGWNNKPNFHPHPPPHLRFNENDLRYLPYTPEYRNTFRRHHRDDFINNDNPNDYVNYGGSFTSNKSKKSEQSQKEKEKKTDIKSDALPPSTETKKTGTTTSAKSREPTSTKSDKSNKASAASIAIKKYWKPSDDFNQPPPSKQKTQSAASAANTGANKTPTLKRLWKASDDFNMPVKKDKKTEGSNGSVAATTLSASLGRGSNVVSSNKRSVGASSNKKFISAFS